MTKIALIAMLLIGLCQILIASTSSDNTWNLWSDFKAYAARVASNDTLKPALFLGGENEKDDLLHLVDKLKVLANGYSRIGNIGILQTTIAALGLCAAFRKKKQNTENRLEATPSSSWNYENSGAARLSPTLEHDGESLKRTGGSHRTERT